MGKGIAIVIFIWHGLAFIVNYKWKNKIYKQGKLDDRIPILQLARFRSKRKKETDESRKMVLNQA